MANYTQQGRPLSIQIDGLDKDALLLEKVTGTEAISELFRFDLRMLAEKPVDFQKLLGRSAAVTLEMNGIKRPINGILSRVRQGPRVAGPQGKATFIRYRAELVPELWLLTRRVHSRIFQSKSVWTILNDVLEAEWKLKTKWAILERDRLKPRTCCVQYQESDFAFISRIMESEGICYYFQHTADGHEMVVADDAHAFPELPGLDKVPYRDEFDSRLPDEPAVHDWDKQQELRACSRTVRDFHFEVMPRPIVERQETKLTPESFSVGREAHALNFHRQVNGVEMLETLEYPAGFAHFRSTVDRNGSPQPAQLAEVYNDASRWARLRRAEEASQCLSVSGGSNCVHFAPGHRFQLTEHFDADNGKPIYLLLTRVEHEASIEGAYTSATAVPTVYSNRFACLPTAVPFRPRRVTPRPRIDGHLTATVVGFTDQEPPGKIVLDRFGRVKVKFHWNRQPDFGWVRVAQVWAGNRWGAFFWPRVGHEVVVSFEDGDPDRPLITGSVYNAGNMPPLELPTGANASGIKSCSVDSLDASTFNAVVFHDTPGQEFLHTHSHMHQADTSRFSRIVNVAGPLYESVGGLFLPAVTGKGSGGGGGESGAKDNDTASGLDAFLNLGSWNIIGGGLLGIAFGDILPRVMPSEGPSPFDDLMGLFPGKTSFVCGDRADITLFGSRVSRVNGGIMGGGADVRWVFPSLLTYTMSSWPLTSGKVRKAIAKLLEFKAAKAAAGLAAVGGFASQGLDLLPSPGAADLIVGSKSSLVYGGPRFTITRGENYELHSSWKAFGFFRRALLLLLQTTSQTSDLLVKIFSNYRGPSRVASPDLVSANLGSAARLLNFIFQSMEKSTAQTVAAKTYVDASKTEAKTSGWMVLKSLVDAKQHFKDATNNVKLAGEEILKLLQGESDDAATLPSATQTTQMYDSDYFLSAKTFDMQAKDGKFSLSGNYVSVDGTDHVSLKGGGVFVEGASELGEVSISQSGLVTSHEITLSSKNNSLTLATKATGHSSEIKLTPTKIALKAGTAALTLDSVAGATLEFGVNKIVIDSLGIKINGLLIDLAANGQLTLDALIFDEKIKGFLKESGFALKN